MFALILMLFSTATAWATTETVSYIDDAGTYAVVSNITYDHTLTLSGDVTLILKDDCTMNVGTSDGRISDGQGIKRDGGEQSLTIYG